MSASETQRQTPVIATVARSDRGKVRAANQDRVICSDSLGVVVVADGVGGHRGGDVASDLATRVMLDTLAASCDLEPKRRLLVAVAEAQRSIREGAERLPHLAGMGTTVVAVLIADGWAHLVHLGDSRAYRQAGGTLERLTRDHSLVEELVSSGLFSSVEEAVEEGVMPSILTRGLGYEDGVEPDYSAIRLRAGDLLLLCTDGLTGMVDDYTLAEILGDASTDLEAKADQLVNLALARGGLDNITLALVRALGPGFES